MTILSLTCRRPLLATALLIATLARPLAAAPEVKEVIAPDLSTAYFGRDNIQVEVLCGPSDESGPLIDLNTIRPENVTLTLTEAQDSSRSGTVFTPIFADTSGEGNNVRVRYTFAVPNLELLTSRWAGTYTLVLSPDEVGEMTSDGSPVTNFIPGRQLATFDVGLTDPVPGEGPNFYRVSAALEQDAPAR